MGTLAKQLASENQQTLLHLQQFIPNFYGVAGAGGEKGQMSMKRDVEDTRCVTGQRGDKRASGAVGVQAPHVSAAICAASGEKGQPWMKSDRANA